MGRTGSSPASRRAVRHTPDEQRALEIGMVSERFAELWEAGVVGRPEVSRKTIGHPQVGLLTPDCNVLRMDGSGLRILGYSAEPGSEDAQKLELPAVVGTQSLAAEQYTAGSCPGPCSRATTPSGPPSSPTCARHSSTTPATAA
ncbi:MmyB family transcriptional regulator [Streptomyces caniscabiei]